MATCAVAIPRTGGGRQLKGLPWCWQSLHEMGSGAGSWSLSDAPKPSGYPKPRGPRRWKSSLCPESHPVWVMLLEMGGLWLKNQLIFGLKKGGIWWFCGSKPKQRGRREKMPQRMGFVCKIMRWVHGLGPPFLCGTHRASRALKPPCRQQKGPLDTNTRITCLIPFSSQPKLHP